MAQKAWFENKELTLNLNFNATKFIFLQNSADTKVRILWLLE
jgi:hypothetical protein